MKFRYIVFAIIFIFTLVGVRYLRNEIKNTPPQTVSIQKDEAPADPQQAKSPLPSIPRPLEMAEENLRRIGGWIKASVAKKPPEFKGWTSSIVDRGTVRYVRYTLLTETPPEEVERLPVGEGTSWYFVGEIKIDGVTKDNQEVQVKIDNLNNKFKKDEGLDAWIPIQEEEFTDILATLASIRYLPVDKGYRMSKYFFDIPIDE